ncbi:hypothetical protein SU69_09155 [Thermosipho melanesiensis]|uniref:Uncharacterized protein n=2 Tax=Thermosipho melanesiensis TaxID=46541 RepID=A6LNZ7_THEM4|nr:hypothetical protein [Thermosipho melanesiensis]ABR31648.1 hypothetical protein Tmel_1813 [Thermosipho melanesiensis BI429]APT74953.1 hypothetical protein BW47_09535 [Thermosipho melanesiensis]OOC35174.1 hypothetical protein SU69_09155 [Thermosipho melanesiensis]OOC35384.1 hypothetical protein SU70_09165 [Thermosipho melanesiensis]OOC36635.1 hypothetical protein SU68_09225 [Thermosipho melanesiensis]
MLDCVIIFLDKGGVIISKEILKKLVDILVISDLVEFEVLHSSYPYNKVKEIYTIFLRQNKLNLLEGTEEFLFEYEAENFEVKVTREGYKYILAFVKIDCILSLKLNSKMFYVLDKIVNNYLDKWLKVGFDLTENYSPLTDLFVENFKNVDGALFSIKEGDVLKIKGASGFDYEIMRDVTFTIDEVYSKRLEGPLVVRLDDVVDEYYLNVNNEKVSKVEFLMKNAHLSRILVMLSIPFYKNGEIFGFVSLYSFENELAFENEVYLDFANTLSKLFTMAFNRI